MSLVGVFAFLGLRWRYEHSFKKVQIVLDYDDVNIVANGSRISPDTMLRTLRRHGATGLALNEQTLTLMRQNGRLSVTPRVKAIQLFPSLRPAFEGTQLSYLVWNRSDNRLMREVEAHLREQSPREELVRAVSLPDGSRGVLVPASSQLFNDASLGYDWRHVQAAHSTQMRPIATMSNRLNIDAPRLERRLAEARATGARLLLFDGPEVPGFNSLSKIFAPALRKHELSFGALEFMPQRGGDELAQAGKGNVYRVHMVAPNEAARWSRDELADRYARAARERNVRVLLVRLMRQPTRSADGRLEDLVATNVRLIDGIRERLKEVPPWATWLQQHAITRDFSLALHTGESGPFFDFPAATLRKRAGNFAGWLQFGGRWLCGLGALGGWLLLLNLFFPIPPRRKLFLVTAGAAGVAVLAGAGVVGTKLLAFMAAAAWPVVAFAWGGWPELLRTQRFSLPLVFMVVLRTLVIALTGGFIIAALLCDWSFLSKTSEFWGTKPAQLLPLGLTAAIIMGRCSPAEVRQRGPVRSQRRFLIALRRICDANYTLRVAALSLLALSVLLFWMMRSGNESSLAVSSLEWKLRAVLEGAFMTRPRNKEIFLAYPALILSFWCAARGRKSAAYALGLVAVLAPIDTINSFCQASNPLSLSLWRSIWGAGLGCLLGALVVTALDWPLVRLEFTRPRLRLAAGFVAVLACFWLGLLWRDRLQHNRLVREAAGATWPWPQATREEVSPGVTHWFDNSAPDGTTLDLIEFDFRRAPDLRFEILDRDSDDVKPFDNRVRYWDEGLAPTVMRAQKQGEVVALVNGAYFGLLNRKPRSVDEAFHLAPVVLSGHVHYNSTNHRWTFGVKSSDVPNSSSSATHSQFAVEHLPSRPELERFQFASGTAQCVVKDGKPLHIEPLPGGKVAYEAPSPVASTPADAGHIRVLDWMKTSRVSFGWNHDSSKLWLLFVKEPDGEASSRAEVHNARVPHGGWSLADVQHFWLKQGAYCAVVTDGGDVAQLVMRHREKWLLIPPRFSTENGPATSRISLSDLGQAPKSAKHGGTPMYFVIRRAPKKSSDVRTKTSSGPGTNGNDVMHISLSQRNP